jgi:hypothetical protein
MIRPLRQVHRHQAILLGILLPIVFVLGIAARKPVPAMAELPQGLVPMLSWVRCSNFDGYGAFHKSPVFIDLWCQKNGSGPFAVSFDADDNFVKPDLMVYWVAGSPSRVETLPADAVLLGAFGRTPLPLSKEVSSTDGRLVLYSLADGEIVDVSESRRLTNEGMTNSR